MQGNADCDQDMTKKLKTASTKLYSFTSALAIVLRKKDQKMGICSKISLNCHLSLNNGRLTRGGIM